MSLIGTKPKRAVQTKVDTVIVTHGEVASWKVPKFQRPLRVNDKVRMVAEEIRHNGGIIPGVICFGRLKDDLNTLYIIDGQHRREAFLISECKEGIVDVRICTFATTAEMAEEFVRLQGHLVQMRPDDVLRGLEDSLSTLGMIRRSCPYVGYDMIRRGGSAPMLSMSATLRNWRASAPETPAGGSCGSAMTLANDLTEEDAHNLIAFLRCIYGAWGKDAEYGVLWKALNITLCMWLYRRIVMITYSPRVPRVTADQFTKCMTALSAAEAYLEYLHGRNLSEVHRAPTYSRLKGVVACRLAELLGHKVALPQPAWCKS